MGGLPVGFVVVETDVSVLVGDGKLVVVVGNGDNVTVLWVGLVVETYSSSSGDAKVVDALCS